MNVSVNIYDDMTLSALLCYFFTHEIRISVDVDSYKCSSIVI